MPAAIPIATYRVQLTANFDFDAAASIVPYLKALGITHLYASPFMKSRKGSTPAMTSSIMPRSIRSLAAMPASRD